MKTQQDESDKVLDFGKAFAERSMESISEGMSAKDARSLAELQYRSRLQGREGKIPLAQRAQWAKNVRNLMNEIRDNGFSVSDLYNTSTNELFKKSYEDAQAYSKNLTAMQKMGSSKQVVGYKKYLEFIELVSQLSGQTLESLAGRITEGIALTGDLVAIPDGCYELAREMEVIASRVGRQKGLIEKFRKLSAIRERHLCSGGSCVWPDADFYFEYGGYTPRPGIKVMDAGGYGNAQCEVFRNSDYLDQKIGSLRVEKNDEPLIADGKRDYRAMYIDNPAKRRLKANTYYVSAEISHSDQRSYPTESGKFLTISPYGDSLFVLPLHFAGQMLETELLDFIRGRYLIHQREELSGLMEDIFDQEPLDTFVGIGSDLSSCFTDGIHFAIFLYPNETSTGLRPIIRIGGEEWCFIAPLNAHVISEFSESVIFPRNVKREFPFQTESLLSYLRMAIDNGELESDWSSTADLIDNCPLWKVEE